MKRRQNDLFKLPNSIFTANLTPTQYKVIAALYSLRSRSIYKGNKYIKISQKALKKICGIKSTQTISDAVNTSPEIEHLGRTN